MSTPVLIGALVAVLGVAAAAGIVLGRGSGEPDPGTTVDSPASQAPGASTRPSLAPNESPSPTATAGPSQPVTPTPTPAPTPSVTAQPTPTPSNTGDTKEVKAEYVSVTVPSDWDVDAKSYWFTVYPTVGGSLFLESGALQDAAGPKTTAAWMKAETERLRKLFPDLTVCGEEKDFQAYGGPEGRAVMLCFTAKTSTGAAYPAKLHVYSAIVIQGNHTLIFHQRVYAAASIWPEVVAAVNPVLRTTKWTLHKGG